MRYEVSERAKRVVQVISTGGFVRNPANITGGFDILLTSA